MVQGAGAGVRLTWNIESEWNSLVGSWCSVSTVDIPVYHTELLWELNKMADVGVLST